MADLVRDLEKGRHDIKDEIKLIDRHTGLLQKEKKIVQRKPSKAFKTFIREIKIQIKELAKQKKQLEKKEIEINKRIEAARIMEKNLSELSFIGADH